MPNERPSGCPACGSRSAADEVESHVDPIGRKEYRLSSCRACEVVFTEPREAVGPEWYAQAAPLRGRESRPPPHRDWRFRQFFADRLPAGRLLDVGCGDGGFLSLAAERGFHPAGFDYDERVVARARERGLADVHGAEFSEFCAGRRPAEFDVITLFDVLEHTPEPSWFLDQLLRLLKPGGYVAVTLPNALRPLPWGREEHDYPPHHFTRWTPRSMAGFLESKGLRVARQEAGVLRLRHLSDHFFFYRLMPVLLSAAKRVLFKGAGARSATVSELYQGSGGEGRGWLADKLRRQRLVDAARLSFQVLSLPAAAVLKARYRLRSPFCGDCLYTLARKP